MPRFSLAAMALLLLAGPCFASSITSTFEDISLAPDSYLNNAGPSGQFVSNGNSFNNVYDDVWGSWNGWAISNTTDTTTGDYTNQYSAITGSGAGGSATYGVAYTGDANGYAGSFINLVTGTNALSIEITNTTYTARTIENGGMGSRPFGPGDYLKLDITGWTGQNGTGSQVGDVTFYLASYTGASLDLITAWTHVDLSSLAGAASLQFGLDSTDVGLYGMNTPAYVAVDNLVVANSVIEATTVPEPSSYALALVGMGLLILRRHQKTQREQAV